MVEQLHAEEAARLLALADAIAALMLLAQDYAQAASRGRRPASPTRPRSAAAESWTALAQALAD